MCVLHLQKLLGLHSGTLPCTACGFFHVSRKWLEGMHDAQAHKERTRETICADAITSSFRRVSRENHQAPIKKKFFGFLSREEEIKQNRWEQFGYPSHFLFSLFASSQRTRKGSCFKSSRRGAKGGCFQGKYGFFKRRRGVRYLSRNLAKWKHLCLIYLRPIFLSMEGLRGSQNTDSSETNHSSEKGAIKLKCKGFQKCDVFTKRLGQTRKGHHRRQCPSNTTGGGLPL